MNDAELRRRLGLPPTERIHPFGPDFWTDCRAMRTSYQMSVHEPLMWTDFAPGPDGYARLIQRPLTVADALAWGERLADEWLA
jgi:hypothetical protein